MNEPWLPKEIVHLEYQITKSKKDEVVQQQLLASLKAVWKVVCEKIPDTVIPTGAFKHIYGDSETKYGNFRTEVTWRIWKDLAETREIYFPENARKRTIELITHSGVLNNYRVFQEVAEKLKGWNWEKYYPRDGKRGPITCSQITANVEHIQKITVSQLNQTFEEIVEDLQSINLSKVGSYKLEMDKATRNALERWYHEKRKIKEKGEEVKILAPPLLIKKRNAGASPKSKKEAVRQLTEKGLKQKDIAAKLGLTDRRVRQLQRDLEGKNMEKEMQDKVIEIVSEYTTQPKHNGVPVFNFAANDEEGSLEGIWRNIINSADEEMKTCIRSLAYVIFAEKVMEAAVNEQLEKELQEQ